MERIAGRPPTAPWYTRSRLFVTLIALGLAACAVSADDTLFEDDFSSGFGHFTAEDDDEVDVAVVAGTYRIRFKTESPHVFRSLSDSHHDGLRFEATLTQVAGDAGDVVATVGCWEKDAGYLLLMLGGEAVILEIVGGRNPDYRLLTDPVVVDAARPPDEGNRLRIDCVGGVDGDDTYVSGWVNGEPVVTVAVAGGYDSFDAVGFWVRALAAGVELAIDDVVAVAEMPDLATTPVDPIPAGSDPFAAGGGQPVRLSDGQVAFASNRDGDFELYLLRPASADPVQLTTNSDAEGDPALSPDGSRIAFASDRDGDFEVYVANVDGSQPRRLTDDPGSDGIPAWSPDGSRIAFGSDRDGAPQVYVMNADGSGVVRLTDGRNNESRLSWSPDGSRIAFGSDRDGDADVYVMNADGSGVVRLTDDPAVDNSPAWSPDGSSIVFVSGRDGTAQVYVMNADGSGVLRLTDDPVFATDPAWSPDGSSIAFVSGRDGNEDLYTMNADGSGQQRLTGHPAADNEVTWSP